VKNVGKFAFLDAAIRDRKCGCFVPSMIVIGVPNGSTITAHLPITTSNGSRNNGASLGYERWNRGFDIVHEIGDIDRLGMSASYAARFPHRPSGNRRPAHRG